MRRNGFLLIGILLFNSLTVASTSITKNDVDQVLFRAIGTIAEETVSLEMIEIIAQTLNLKISDVMPESDFENDLKADLLHMYELKNNIESHYHIDISDFLSVIS